jgi:Ca2+-transporting ATPase
MPLPIVFLDRPQYDYRGDPALGDLPFPWFKSLVAMIEKPDFPQNGWHSAKPEEVLAHLQSSEQGLGSDDARGRLEQFGSNTLPEDARKAMWRVFFQQFQSPLIYILFAAALLAFTLGKREDSWVILIVVLVNSIIGTFQEGRAERSMEALRKLSSLRVRVLRDQEERSIESADLVPGDVMLLAAGDAVVADGRLLDARVFEVAEAALTGESLPVLKQSAPLPPDTLLADRKNMIYSGTHVTAGRGRAVVVATGPATEVGKIARLTAAAQSPKTPLELRMEQLGRTLVLAAILLFTLVVAAGILRGLPIVDILMVAVSQMVSVVPEGLPVALTIALAVGMQRMARRGAIVRTLSSVETLGCTTVICTDKTGTLTNNEMTATDLWLADGRALTVSGSGYSPNGELSGLENPADSGLRLILEAGVLCNDSQLVPPDKGEGRWRALGDPTEAALLTLAMKGGVEPAGLRREWPRRAEIPFDAANKLMATQHGHTCMPGRVFIKGAPEWILPLCAQAWRDGQPEPLDENGRAQALRSAGELAEQALRLLGFAMLENAEIDESSGFDQFGGRAVFLGWVGQIDPPREDTRDAVRECRRAGIRPVMVTGDHLATGLAIARMLDIAREGDRAVDGRELEEMPEQYLVADLDRIAVFSRVHPAQKLRIVEAFQSQQYVVAMTGDGVNDAPALARADVGVAMGITGTEVAKSASNIVITDDRFATIVDAVEQGRLIYGNIRKLLLFLFATSIDEVIVLLGALWLGYPLPLAAVQILWINLVTEGTLTINLVMEGPEGDEMERAPVRSRDPLFDMPMLRRMALMVPTSVLATLGYFIWRLGTGAPFALVQTETFTVLAVCQWFNALNCESSTRSALRLGILKNPWLLGGLLLANLMQIAVVYTAPLNRLFHTVPIPVEHVFLIGLVASSVLWVEEIRKILARRRLRHSGKNRQIAGQSEFI